MVEVERRGETDEGTTTQTRYYISSQVLHQQPGAAGWARLAAARKHWSIENSLHWSMDATYREDQSLVWKDHGTQNIATLRQISHNNLKRETSPKAGIRGKRLQAGGKITS